MILSDSTFAVKTEYGNTIVYSIQPKHLNDIPGSTLRDRCMMYGSQLAVCINNQWYKPGAKQIIDDLRTIALLERAPMA